ncbi:hypothetical protein [Roseivirga sp. UBA1976]|uniref:hypothetical protein n=1 Tax=Roseivirga sp. UBA1976 TaxID=1947386 RepID=UPI00257CE6CE|nr:hypothetical protein [Roseivirga sp. UBA1976]|tara:strand:+ start:3269 stop:3697 length:429 start_codon:yes stop_codon:yes gene_type:complete
MRLTIITVLFCLSVAVQAQTKNPADTTVYFFGNFELKSGLQVLTDTDSLVVSKKMLVSNLSAVQATNKQLLLRVAKEQLGAKAMRLKNPNTSKLIHFFATKPEMEEAVRQLKFSNENSLYYLRDFEFIKEVGLQGPGNPVIK